jgi:hypothetical protein
VNYVNFDVVQMFTMIELILEAAEGELDLLPQPMGLAVMLFSVRHSSHCESVVMVVMGGSRGELGMGAVAAGADDDEEQCLGQWTGPDQMNCGTRQEGCEKQNQVFLC